LEQFPSPQPLSEQEQMLARYVEELPSEAKQIAQAQTELARHDEIEFEKQGQLANPSGDSPQ
jgi:prefoldin subunit 5